MLWFFERENARLHYEIRRRSDGDDFELVITGRGGRQRIEQFRAVADVEARSRELQEKLTAAGWRTPLTAAAGRRRMLPPPSRPAPRC